MNRKILKGQKKRQTIDQGRTALRHGPFAGVPELACRQTPKQRRVFQSILPPPKNFVQCLGVDLILCVREFVGHGMFDLVPLMLASKDLYKFLRNQKTVNRAIAKDIFGFSYLLTFRECVYTFADLLRFRDNISGCFLHHTETKTRQLLGNARLRNKEAFVFWMKLVVVDYQPKSRTLKCLGRSAEVQRLQEMFLQFEENHSAIQMKLYRPFSSCYPVQPHSCAVAIKAQEFSHLEEVCQTIQQGQKISVGLQLSLQISHLYYRFELVLHRLKQLP